MIDKPRPVLEPRLWNKYNQLNENVRRKILDFAQQFLGVFNRMDQWLQDIVIGGSYTTNQYNKDSDLDVAFLINFERFCDFNLWCKDTAHAYFFLKNRMNALAKYMRFIDGIKVTFFLTRRGKEYPSPGLYSVLKKRWIREPFFFPLDLEPDIVFGVLKRLAKIVAQMLYLLKEKVGLEIVQQILAYISRRRQFENFARGDFNEINIFYKYLEKYLED